MMAVLFAYRSVEFSQLSDSARQREGEYTSHSAWQTAASGTVFMSAPPRRTSNRCQMGSDGQAVSPGYVLHFAAPALADDKRPEPNPPTTAPAVGPESVQDLIFLGDNRPIFLRLRMTLGTQGFRPAGMH